MLPACPRGGQVDGTGARDAAGFEFARELSDDVPASDRGRAIEGGGKAVLYRRRWRVTLWPKRDRFPRSYVNSRIVVRTRVHRESPRV